MTRRSVGNFYKDAIGAVLLLACAFFVCSTLLSMRAVLADPIAPAMTNATGQSSGRTSGRASPRGTAATAARPTTDTPSNSTSSRGVATRNVAARSNRTNANASRGVVARTSRSTADSRNVVSRNAATRNVRARSGTERVSVNMDVIRGAKGTNTTTYTYLSNKLYSGNYSNIIDSTTGLISADAYSTCLESYYTCMDEICTARSEAQRRCACAGRVKAFAEAESKLESANEELIKVSGELALLIANKGKDVSSAFSLTDAEKVMNCASWREASRDKKASKEQFGTWCEDHGMYDSSQCSVTQAPSYCTNKSVYGFDVKDLDGAGSDILASLAQWADDVKASTDTILTEDNDSLISAFTTMTNAVSGITGATISLSSDEVQDTLAETWGYDLFRYAHNNV
ncbi:MAG: hypothetical protein J5613_01395 [Alphaproteobacteria bacterium]|nr:hypothetical protein [Alphaproteobacteria bacterium]